MSTKRAPLTLPAGDPRSPGELALRMVLEHFALRRQGQIIKTDEVAHCALQAIRGYQLMKLDHTEQVARYFPQLYELLSRIHQEIIDEVLKSDLGG